MATIYTMNGEYISGRIHSSVVSDEAFSSALDISRQRGETLRLEDGEDITDVHPDGTVTDGDSWDSSNAPKGKRWQNPRNTRTEYMTKVLGRRADLR